MSQFDSIEIDINPCDHDDIDEQIQIYVYNTLVNEFSDDKMDLKLNEKEMRHYQDYGQYESYADSMLRLPRETSTLTSKRSLTLTTTRIG